MRLKRNQFLNAILFLYTVLSFVILFFNLGNTRTGKAFTSLVAKVVPSIMPTAAITRLSNSSALVLAFSWLMVVVCTLAMILIANWKAIDYEGFYKKTSRWIIFGMFLIFPTLMIYIAYHVPDDSGMYNRFLYFNLKDTNWFVVLYGAGIWLSFSAGIFSIIFNLNYFFKNIRER